MHAFPEIKFAPPTVDQSARQQFANAMLDMAKSVINHYPTIEPLQRYYSKEAFLRRFCTLHVSAPGRIGKTTVTIALAKELAECQSLPIQFVFDNEEDRSYFASFDDLSLQFGMSKGCNHVGFLEDGKIFIVVASSNFELDTLMNQLYQRAGRVQSFFIVIQ